MHFIVCTQLVSLGKDSFFLEFQRCLKKSLKVVKHLLNPQELQILIVIFSHYLFYLSDCNRERYEGTSAPILIILILKIITPTNVVVKEQLYFHLFRGILLGLFFFYADASENRKNPEHFRSCNFFRTFNLGSSRSCHLDFVLCQNSLLYLLEYT